MLRVSNPRYKVPLQLRRRIPNWLIVLMPAVAGLLGILLYRQALSFTFFNDDPTGHFAWMEGKRWWAFFLTSAEYGYYRPIVFTTLRLVQTLFGGHHPVAHHALLLLLHGANIALVWWLAYVLSGRKVLYAWIAALVFATVPFSYEAVVYVASLTHPLLLFWLLLTLLFYHLGRETGRWFYRAAAFLTYLLGLLTHENGLLIPLALLGLIWVVERPPLRSLLRQLWPYFIPLLLYLPLWFSIPKEGEQSLASPANLASNVIPFLQTLVYPLLPLFNLDAADTVWLLLLALAVVVGSGILAYRENAGRLWLFALGWAAAGALPATLFLSPDYLYGSPRLHYLPSIGVALLWAIPALRMKDEGRRMKAESHPSSRNRGQNRRLPSLYPFLFSIVYILALTLPHIPFIRCQIDFYAQASAIVREMGRRAAEAPDGREVVFVNLPFFFSSYAAHPDGCPNAYPWTPVGAVVVPPYAHAQDFVRYNGGLERAIGGVTYEGYGPGWTTFGPPLAAGELRAAVEESAVYVFDLTSGTFFDLSAAWKPAEAFETTPLATFGGTVDLISAEMNSDDGLLTLRLRWQLREETAEPLTAFAHFYSPSGDLLTQHDLPLGEGFVTADLWQPGDVVGETHLLTIPTPLPELGTYPIAVGLYHASNGERLPATAEGRPLADDVYEVGTIMLMTENDRADHFNEAARSRYSWRSSDGSVSLSASISARRRYRLA
jgi:hypothetical protein